MMERTQSYQAAAGIILVVLVLTVLSAFELRLLLSGKERYFAALAQAGADVLAGKPVLVAFQNRLLASAFQAAIERMLAIDAALSFKIGLMAALVVMNAAALAVLTRVMDGARAAGVFAAFTAAWLLMNDDLAIYVWDIFDLLAFVVLYGLIVAGARQRWLWLLFAIAVLNRESAVFVGVWLMIAAIRPVPGQPIWRAVRIHRGDALGGLAMVVIAAAVTVGLRKALVVAPQRIGPTAIDGVGNHMNLMQNLRDLQRLGLETDAVVLVFLIVMMVVGTLALFQLIFRGQSRLEDRMAVLLLAMTVANIVAGLIFETRIYFIFAPFLAHLTLDLLERKWPGSPSARR